jgi:hypothetical protein
MCNVTGCCEEQLLEPHWFAVCMERCCDFVDPPLRSGLFLSASSHLYTDFLCLLGDPVRIEDLPPGVPVYAWTPCWMDIIAAMASFICGMPLPPFPQTPLLRPAHACSTPSSADSTTMDSLDCSHAYGCKLQPQEGLLNSVQRLEINP